MRKTSLYIFSIFLFLFFITPFSASAQSFLSFPFGGRITSVVPCSGALGPALHVVISSSRIGAIGLTEPYIYTFGETITELVGPPVPAAQITGLADIPYVCFIGGGFFIAPVPLVGWRMQYIGTSIPGGGLFF